MDKQKKITHLKFMIGIIKKIIILVNEKIRLMKDYDAFKEALGMRESSGRYDIVNPWGYLGKYQFGMERLCDLGYTEKVNGSLEWITGCSEEIFLNSPQLQDLVFFKHVEDLKKQVYKHFSHYLDRKVNGINITVSGLVAMAHLTGMNGAKQFFKGSDFADANGTKGSDYLKRFSGYNI